jgi:xanthine dehydrogenase accessory factor
VVWLLFEPVRGGLADVLALLGQRRKEDSCRITAIDGEAECRLVDERHAETHIRTDAEGRRWLVDPFKAPRAHLVLFGAGHVGAAIVRALAGLPCTVTWVDERDAIFPAELPDNVTIEATDTPEACVDGAPDNASYLVLTHSHALDLQLTEAILRRPKVGWFGLIGSKTKRAQFTSRLAAKGLSTQDMVCPIGLPGIINKAPAVIAASVAAQLLMAWESQARD